ncbi:MAG: hypothetical protein JNL94_18985, partial [Planctomycetes bacterium]|nr:hypothetical protein [Planctomycetota bacterium]
KACEEVLAPIVDLADDDALLLAQARRRNGRNDAAIVGLRALLERPSVLASPLELHARFELVETLLDANDAAGALVELDRIDDTLRSTNDEASSLRSRDLRAKATGAKPADDAGEKNGIHKTEHNEPAVFHGATRTR